MRRQWTLFAFALAALAASLSPHPVAGQPKQAESGKRLVTMTVDATPPPRPALKYRLLPELRDLQPGNQVQAFYKCFFEQNHLFHNKEETNKREKWLQAPLTELAGVKELVGYGGTAAKQAHFAARLDTVDWQITTQARAEGVMLLLPDLQQLRSLATVLKVRVRGEIARGEFDNAVHTLQTMFALARTFNDHPTLIGHLVGAAVAAQALGAVEEFVQQPGAPNLFWALVDLPAPLLDLRRPSQGERLLVTKEFDLLGRRTAVDERDLKSHLRLIDPLLGPAAEKPDERPGQWYARQAADKDAVAAARDRLLKHGFPAADLDKFPPLQVVMADDFAQYEVSLDEYTKWTNVPIWKVPADFAPPKRPPGPLGTVLPAWRNVMLAKARLEQHVALITTEEAVRAHAAENGGKLPAALDAVKLPLPADPATGKLLTYELKDGRATLYGTPPSLGQVPGTPPNRAYEITIRK